MLTGRRVLCFILGVFFRFFNHSNQTSEAFEEPKEAEALDQEETHEDHDDDESLQEEVGCGCGRVAANSSRFSREFDAGRMTGFWSWKMA